MLKDLGQEEVLVLLLAGSAPQLNGCAGALVAHIEAAHHLVIGIGRHLLGIGSLEVLVPKFYGKLEGLGRKFGIVVLEGTGSGRHRGDGGHLAGGVAAIAGESITVVTGTGSAANDIVRPEGGVVHQTVGLGHTVSDMGVLPHIALDDTLGDEADVLHLGDYVQQSVLALLQHVRLAVRTVDVHELVFWSI